MPKTYPTFKTCLRNLSGDHDSEQRELQSQRDTEQRPESGRGGARGLPGVRLRLPAQPRSLKHHLPRHRPMVLNHPPALPTYAQGWHAICGMVDIEARYIRYAISNVYRTPLASVYTYRYRTEHIAICSISKISNVNQGLIQITKIFTYESQQSSNLSMHKHKNAQASFLPFYSIFFPSFIWLSS